MVNESRLTWFAITFLFVLPSMILLFRGDAGMTSRGWITSSTFAAVIAVSAAALFGKGDE